MPGGQDGGRPSAFVRTLPSVMRGHVRPLWSFVPVALADVRRRRLPVVDHARHLDAAVDWLVRAHDMSPDDGVSYGYSVRGGWRPSYIETTGYIAVTFFELARRRSSPDLRARALRMADWLCSVQNADGSFPNPHLVGGRGVVFDTGQDIFGLVRAHVETGEERYLAAATAAADWLVGAADPDGRWSVHDYLGVPHVYNARTAWALLKLHQLAPGDDRDAVARANLDFAVAQQRASGFFDHCSFEPGRDPFTHTIAYTIRGLWESGELVDEDRYRDSARRAAEAMVPHVRPDGFVPGQIDVDGGAAATYCCLTGNCQLAISWAKMAKAADRADLRDAAVTAVRYVLAHQDIGSKDDGIRGAVKGSQPVWGRYSRFTYPNWATKFLVDALHETEDWW